MARRRLGLRRIALQPAEIIEMVELLVPDHAGEGLALHDARVGRGHVVLQPGIEIIRLAVAQLQDILEVHEGCREFAAAQAQPHLERAAGGNALAMPQPGLGAAQCRIDAVRPGLDDVFVEAVLEVAGGAEVPQPLPIGLVLGEQALRAALDIQPAHAEGGGLDGDGGGIDRAQLRLERAGVPAPGVAQHQLRNDVERGCVGTTVDRRGLHQQVAGLVLRIFDEHVEIPVLGKHSRVDEFVLRLIRAAPRVLRHEIRVGVGPLRILVKHLQVRVRRRRVEVEVLLLHVLAVIALGVRQAEKPLLEDGVNPVPQRQQSLAFQHEKRPRVVL